MKPSFAPHRSASNCFQPFLTKYGACILDGGLTTSLPNNAEKHFLWGHQLLYNLDGGLPALKKVHLDFLNAGAKVIGTLSYKLSLELVKECWKRGMLNDMEEKCAAEEELESHTEMLFQRSIQAAKDARDEYWSGRIKTASTTTTAHLGNDSSKPPATAEPLLNESVKPLVFGSVGPCRDSTMLFVGATDPNTRSDGSEMEIRMRTYYRQKLGMLKKV